MRKIALAAVCSALVLGLAACGGETSEDAADTTVVTEDADTGAMAGGTAAGGAGATGSAWPEGSRIVEEGGTTYRVDASGARVALTPNDSRIVAEGSTRYRVDSDGTRVEIDTTGNAVRIGDSVITGNAPNGASDIETPGETVTDAAEDAAEAVGDVVD